MTRAQPRKPIVLKRAAAQRSCGFESSFHPSRAGADDNTQNTTIGRLEASAGAEAVARLRGGSEKVARRGSSGHHERVHQSLWSGALALRKYACDANAKWGTMHVSVKHCK
eukprot:6197063-Pleurochrysis_carterae.AAC.1